MSKFDKYKTSSKFDKYRNPKVVAKETSPSFLDRLGQFGKGALSGFSRAGLLEGADQFGAGVMEVGGAAVPILPQSAEVMAKSANKGLEALDSMRPAKDDSFGNVLYKAGEFGGATASMPMMPGRAATGVKSLWPFAKDIAMGSTIGAGSGALEGAGLDPIYADLISILAAPTSTSIMSRFASPKKNIVYPISRKVLGINKNNFNLEAAEAAQRLGVDLPISVYNPSSTVSVIDQKVGKSPFYGDSLQRAYQRGENRVKDILEETYDKVGPQRTDELVAEIDKLYGKAKQKLPKDATVLPENTVERLRQIENSSLRPSADETAVFNYKNDILGKLNPPATINGKVIENFTPPLEPIPVQTLIDTKRSLNSPNPSEPIRWKNPDRNVRNTLKRVGRGYSQDIAEYGKTNPDWHKTFKKADKLHGMSTKRDNLENLIGQKAYNYATDSLQYNALAKILNNPKNFKKIKNELKSPKDKEILESLKDLGKISSAISIKNKNIPNPSGTAIMANVLKLFSKPLHMFPEAVLQYPQYKALTSSNFLKDTIESVKKSKSKAPFKEKLFNDAVKYGYPISVINYDQNVD